MDCRHVSSLPLGPHSRTTKKNRSGRYRSRAAFSIGLFLPALLLSAVLFALSGSYASGQSTGPLLLVEPDGGPAGTAVRLTGRGFSPNSVEATLFWDGQPISRTEISKDGSFVIDLFAPSGAPVGDHRFTACEGSGCTQSSASAPFSVEKALPYFGERIAYLFAKDKGAALAIEALLAAHGLSIELVHIDDVTRVDFAQYDLVLIADDTGLGSIWAEDNPEIFKLVSTAPRFLGIGEGGYAFFGKMDLQLGYPNGFHSSGQQISAADPNLSLWRTPFHMLARLGSPFDIYSQRTGMVVIPDSRQVGDMITIAHPSESGDPLPDGVILRQGCATLWGYRGGPTTMTEDGIRLFVNLIISAAGGNCEASPTNLCTSLTSPVTLPGAIDINFDELKDGTPIADFYAGSHGVRFENGANSRAIAYADRAGDLAKARTAPNVARNAHLSPTTSSQIPMRISFIHDQSYVGLWIGNGGEIVEIPTQTAGLLSAFDRAGKLICQIREVPVPISHTQFVGFHDQYGRIATLLLDYGTSENSESVDTLTFGPFGAPNNIRVCADTQDGCLPVAGAQVHHIRPNDPTGWTFTTDAQGYVNERRKIRYGDGLWPTRLISKTKQYDLFHTGESRAVNAQSFAQAPNGTLELSVSPNSPLMVYHLRMALQFSLQNNPAYRAWLIQNVIDAANYFYDWTNGQMTLGSVHVYQNYDEWEDSNIWTFSSNVFRPHAEVGGIVSETTPDPQHGEEKSYYPGQVFMGRSWNRYSEPVAPPDVGVDLSHDWSLALAHELGHYLLFLYDTYLNMTETGGIVETESCTGSAMGWVYNQEVNGEFIADEKHWLENCADTYANVMLERTEWKTILTWYGMMTAPAPVIEGPAHPPIPLTQVTIHPPSTPVESFGPQVFELLYADDERASEEARVVIFRNGRVLDQGRPVRNTNLVAVTEIQANDRFCVYDVNDYTDDDDNFPRHQFGCEVVESGDTQLQMKKDLDWAPIIEVTPVTSKTILLTVTQSLDGVSLKARLYPEHDSNWTEITLTPDGDRHSGTFNSSVPATAAYIQIFVDEPETELNPRRETMVDYGVGGSGVNGPTSWFDSVPIVSSDGKAEFAPGGTVHLAKGEFAAIQSMIGTPAPPFDSRIVGQAYRLVASPARLVATGEIVLRLRPQRVAALEPAEALPNATVHYFNGRTWEPLATTHITDQTDSRVALATSRGVGIYALLLERPGVTHELYLPSLSR